MKEKLKRSLGLLLALVMVAGMFPVSVFAEEAEPISTEAVDSVIDEILTDVGEEAPVPEQVTSFVSNVIGPLQLEEEPEAEPEPETEAEPETEVEEVAEPGPWICPPGNPSCRSAARWRPWPPSAGSSPTGRS